MRVFSGNIQLSFVAKGLAGRGRRDSVMVSSTLVLLAMLIRIDQD